MTALLPREGVQGVSRQSPWEVGKQYGVRRNRLLIGVALAFAAVSGVFGFPTGREVITLWLLAFLFAVVGGDPRTWRRTVVHDWLPLLVGLSAYDLLRGFAKGSAGRAHITPQLRLEERLFGGTAPTEWLQAKLYDCVPAWYDYAIVPVYMSHFVVPLAVAAGLWATSYDRFRTWVMTLMTLTVMTLVTYALLPAAPPWLASETAAPGGGTYLPFIERVTSHTVAVSGIPTIHNAVQRGEAYANPVAALPSFHSAVPMLVLLTFWPVLGRVGRTLLAAYPLVMTFALVYGGEHYVVDVLMGWAYAGIAVALVAGWQRRRRRMRRLPVAAALPDPERVEASPGSER